MPKKNYYRDLFVRRNLQFGHNSTPHLFNLGQNGENVKLLEQFSVGKLSTR